jgi:hypothetical protein
MSILNMTTHTSRNIKDVSLALVLIGSLIGATLSTSASAAPAGSVEKAVSKFVVTQGQNMIDELNNQLQLSIENEINAISTNFSLNNTSMWLTAEKQVNETVENKINNQTNSNANTNKNQTK